MYETDDETAQAEIEETTSAPEGQQPQAAQADETPQETPDAAKTTPPPATPPTPAPDPQSQPAPQTAVKLVSYNDIVAAVREAIWALFDEINRGLPDNERQWISSVRVYEGFGVVSVGLQHWRFEYSLENGVATLTPKSQWQMVEPDWVIKTIEDATVVYPGAAVKAIGQDGDGWVGGYLVRFTDPDNPDLVGDYFDESTDFGPHGKSLVWFNHALDQTLGHKTLGVKADGRFAEAALKTDDVGVWIQMQLDMRDEYERALYYMAKAQKVGWSSGTATHLVKRSLVSGKAYHVDSWPLGLDASITPTPAAGPSLTAVTPLKTYRKHAGNVSIKSLMTGLEIPDARKAPPTFLEVLKSMDPKELIEKFGEIVDAKLQPIVDQVGEQAKTLEAFKAAPATNRLPQGDAPEGDGGNGNGDPLKAVAKDIYVQQFGEPDAAMKAVMTDIVGQGFEQDMFEQTRVFAKWVRFGDKKLSREEERYLYRQLLSPSDIKAFVYAGLTVREIKARITRAEENLQGVPLPPYIQERFAQKMGGIKDTMFTGSGQLGGYAIAPMREDIISRLPGSTVVRAGGARVVDLINATSVDVPVYSGGDDRYRGAVRGAWGGEKVSSPETNATLQMASVQAHPYTFKVPMTRTMLMAAGNVVDLLTDDIIDVAAIDEDEAFLVGDGTGGQPLGIIPGGARLASLGIGYVQHSAITADKLIELSDDLDDQYVEGAMFVFKKATSTSIRQLKDAVNGDYLLKPGLEMGAPGTLLGHPYRRNQAMPASASGACPVLFGRMAGYLIVQEPGLTIERFQDSNTGIGQVEFHVWRMLGGRIERPWMFSVLEIT